MSVKIFKFILRGNPIPKQRSRKGWQSHWYNPQRQLKERQEIELLAQLPQGFISVTQGVPVKMNCTFFLKPSKTEMKSKKFLDLIKNDDYPYTKKPDKDNLEKWVMDLLSIFIIADDNQIYSGASEKFYSLNPRTEIEVVY